MVLTELPIVTEASSLGNKPGEKALLPIVVTEFGIVTEVSFVSKNARSPIVVTEFGIVTEVSWAP